VSELEEFCRPPDIDQVAELDASAAVLRTARGELALGGPPWLMGIVNATPDSFSDAGMYGSLEQRVTLAEELVQAGAQIIDIGGESGVTNRPPVPPEVEISRVVPLVQRVSGELGVTVSIDTYKPQVARAAITAGASIVNDTSGLRDPGLADVCAATGAALVNTLKELRRLIETTLPEIRLISGMTKIPPEK